MKTAAKAKYIARLDGVWDVALRGSANLEYWSSRLAGSGIAPHARGGKADLMLSAISSRFRGISFCELCIALSVEHDEPLTNPSGLFLMQAFNSSRLFAWCERVFFATPYLYAPLEVPKQGPVGFHLSLGGRPALNAVCRAASNDRLSPHEQAATNDASEKLQPIEECWEGPIFLPGRDGQMSGCSTYFAAVLSGMTVVRPFSLAADTFTVVDEAAHPILKSLVESRFAPQEWRTRDSAYHARSKTFRRHCPGQ